MSDHSRAPLADPCPAGSAFTPPSVTRPTTKLASGDLTEGDQPAVLSALCDILACTPTDLVVTTAENAGVRRTGTTDPADQQPVVAKLRPRPARILPEG